VGFVGATGSGKTTIIDLIIGLLNPTKGQILADGEIINRENQIQWKKNISYVPQFIFLLDSSIRANIAFGYESHEIDMDKIHNVSKLACVHDFVQKQPLGYDTIVGERGVQLSGGEKQRIGIARALYRNSSVLVFDEATSALDNVTENKLMKNIHHDPYQRTIILIAHRMSTVVQCDVIFVLKNGKLIAKGTYDNLLKSCALFSELANSKLKNL
jgi:ABC-type multidrug transport system fused ATPase/permease subunit